MQAPTGEGNREDHPPARYKQSRANSRRRPEVGVLASPSRHGSPKDLVPPPSVPGKHRRHSRCPRVDSGEKPPNHPRKAGNYALTALGHPCAPPGANVVQGAPVKSRSEERRVG